MLRNHSATPDHPLAQPVGRQRRDGRRLRARGWAPSGCRWRRQSRCSPCAARLPRWWPEHVDRSEDVDRRSVLRIRHRRAHVRTGGEVEDEVGPVRRERLAQRAAVADVVLEQLDVARDGVQLRRGSVLRSSTTSTDVPRPAKASTTDDPTNPAPPVTTARSTAMPHPHAPSPLGGEEIIASRRAIRHPRCTRLGRSAHRVVLHGRIAPQALLVTGQELVVAHPCARITADDRRSNEGGCRAR